MFQISEHSLHFLSHGERIRTIFLGILADFMKIYLDIYKMLFQLKTQVILPIQIIKCIIVQVGHIFYSQ